MGKYHIIPGAHHIGNLDQHSKWTMEQVKYCLRHSQTEKHCEWCSQVNPRNTDLLALAAFFHDVGKMGPSKYISRNPNGTFSYQYIPKHEIRSWKYLLGLESLLWDSTPVDLSEYIQKTCGLSPVQMAVVAILARLHYHLGNYGPKQQYKAMCRDILKQITHEKLPKEWHAFWKTCPQQEVADEIFRMFLCLATMDVVGARPMKNKAKGYKLLNSYHYGSVIDYGKIMDTWVQLPERKKLRLE